MNALPSSEVRAIIDGRLVYTKTAKGLREVIGKTSGLSRGWRNILKKIDGRRAVAELQEEFSDYSQENLQEALEALVDGDYIREFLIAPKSVQILARKPSANIDAESLDFTAKAGPASRVKAAKGRLSSAAKKLPKKASDDFARAETEIRAKILANVRAAEEACRESDERAERSRREAEEVERSERLAAERIARHARHEAEEKVRYEVEEQLRRTVAEAARKEAEAKVYREAEERARREAEEVARCAAEAAAREEARVCAQREADEHARLEAEEAARQAAAEQAHREAEAARRKAEDRARREAEEVARCAAEAAAREEARVRAQREADERARLEAEEAARQAAAEQARREEESARRKAEERARRDAEQAARRAAKAAAREEARVRAQREAEDLARREAEALARLEAEECARREAEETAQRTAEAVAREEIQARTEHEAAERVRLELEAAASQAAQEQAQAQREAETARREAAERARLAEEEAARQAAEDPVHREAEALAQRQAEATERMEAAADAQAQAQRAAEDRARRKAEARPLPEPERRVEPVAGVRPPRRRTRWGQRVFTAVGILAVAGLAVVHVLPFEEQRAHFEQVVAEQWQQPVAIKSLRFALLPRPHWHMESVVIGRAGQMALDQVDLMAGFGALLGTDDAYAEVTIGRAQFDAEGAQWLMFGKARSPSLKVARIDVREARVDLKPVVLPAFSAHIELASDGRWQKANLEATESRMSAELQPQGDVMQIDLNAVTYPLPFGTSTLIENIHARGVVRSDALEIAEFTGHLLGGSIGGTARLNWGDTWSLVGELDARQIDIARLAPKLLEDGVLEGRVQYAFRATAADSLFAKPYLDGRFSVHKGTLLGIDAARFLQGAKAGGKTSFSEMVGKLTLDHGQLQLRQLRLGAGAITATGSARLDQNKALQGRLALDLASPGRQRSAGVAVAGTLEEPRFGAP